MNIQAPKGMKDILPKDSYKWHYIESNMRFVAESFGFREVRTPVVEHTELFLRGIGDTTDVVQKEMYTFTDKGNRSITLKPEGTAGVVRQFIENKLYAEPQPTKMYYLNCPVFRYEKPQAGRLREHHQFGVELFGGPDASADAEVITLALELLGKLGVTDTALHINSIGCPQCRPKYAVALKEYYKDHINDICEDCRARLEKNPLRLLDCKNEKCKQYAANASTIIEYICDDCKAHFALLQAYLTDIGVQFTINPRIVRGLDYYTKTVFEIISTNIGAQGTVCGGGRYDGLVEEIGGPSLAGVGFGMGMERLLLVMEHAGVSIPEPKQFDLYIAHHGSDAKRVAFKMAIALRKRGVKTELDHANRSIKAQFKYADKLGVKYVAIIGDEELSSNTIKIKNMQNGTQKSISMYEFAAFDKNSI